MNSTPTNLNSTDDVTESFTESNITELGGNIRAIFLVIGAILMVFGTGGNVVSVVILRSGELKKLSTCFYMSVLAVMDTGVLWTATFAVWMRLLTEGVVRPFTWFNCKLFFFVSYTCGCVSSTTLAIMSIEKWFALYFPLKSKNMCTVKIAQKISLINVMLFAVYNSQCFFNAKAVKDELGFSSCEFIHIDFELVALIQTLFYVVIPFLVMVIFNSAIIGKLCSKKPEFVATGSSAKLAKQGTKMVLSVTCVFILLTLPVNVYLLVFGDPFSNELYPLFAAVASLNHSINALLYMFSGSKYREDVKKMFELRCRRNRVVGVATESPNAVSQQVTASSSRTQETELGATNQSVMT